MINRPPPRHPGVQIPGIKVPANAGNIQDIIKPKPIPKTNYTHTAIFKNMRAAHRDDVNKNSIPKTNFTHEDFLNQLQGVQLLRAQSL